MDKIIKQSVGIDVSNKTLDVTFSRLNEDFSVHLFLRKVFKNDRTGHKELLKVAKEWMNPVVQVRFVMEATGVYHERLAYYLHSKNQHLSIVLPNKISSYMRTLAVKTITDKTSADAIAQFGLERKLEDWEPPKEIYRTLRQLTRERDQLVDERSAIKNRLHAEQKEAMPNTNSLRRLKERIKFLSKQEAEIKKDIEITIKAHQGVCQEIEYISSIPGVGKLTAVIILAETNGFELIKDKKQLTSYAGLDVREKQSGTSVRGTSRISKKGNRHLRGAMYLPSLCSIRFNEQHRQIYARIVQKHGIKKKALVAIQRRLLELSYILFKAKAYFDQEYETKNPSKTSVLLGFYQPNLTT